MKTGWCNCSDKPDAKFKVVKVDDRGCCTKCGYVAAVSCPKKFYPDLHSKGLIGRAPYKFLTVDMENEVIRLRSRGIKAKAIAKTIGIDLSTVYSIIRKGRQ